MNREKRLTKRERKAATAPAPSAPHAHAHDDQHIHCVACGRHIDIGEFDDPATAAIVECAHKTPFPACVGCQSDARRLLEEHDRTGRPVRAAAAHH